MNPHRTKNISYLISAIVHIGLMLLFMAFRFTIEHEEIDFVEIGFGTFGRLSSSGAVGKTNEKNEIENKKEVITQKKDENKKVELPVVKNVDEENPVAAIEEKKKDIKEIEPVKPLVDKENNNSKGRELTGEGVGKFGFDIDFGGKGKRKIYSYTLPKYPEGVAKEIDVKLRFTILADGTVGRIIPIIKADTRLETAAINSLRQWRFEPLPPNQASAEQTAVIVFPFRLE